MKRIIKPFAVGLGVLLATMAIAGCSGSPAPAGSTGASSAAPLPKVTVNVGVHKNGGGSSTVAVAISQGFFDKHGIKANVTVVDSGPVEMTAMRADKPTLDIGYIGPGVAWNPLDSSGNQLSFVFFDNLGNSEALIARVGQFTDTNGDKKYDNAEIYAGLKGKTVYLEIGTTPGGWFKNLLAAVNDGHPAAQQLWLASEDPSYLAGYTAPNSNPAYKVQVVNYANANIAAGMATGAGNDRIDIAVAFAPIPATIMAANKDIEQIADISALPKDKVFPATFVANAAWLKNNPDVAKNFVMALYEAATWRAENTEAAMRAAEQLTQSPDGTFGKDGACYYPTKADYQAWFATPTSQGYNYLNSLYKSAVNNVPAGVTPKTLEQALDFTNLLDAIATIK